MKVKQTKKTISFRAETDKDCDELKMIMINLVSKEQKKYPHLFKDLLNEKKKLLKKNDKMSHNIKEKEK